MLGPHRNAASSRALEPQSSGELLLRLCEAEPVRRLLAAHGTEREGLAKARHTLPREAPESADWRLRLSARGGDEGDLALLLAICRSADAEAYRLLEHVGVRCHELRRDVIDLLRAEGESRLRAGPQPNPRPVRTRGPANEGPRGLTSGRGTSTSVRPASTRSPRATRALASPPTNERASARRRDPIAALPPNEAARPERSSLASPPSSGTDTEAHAEAPPARASTKTARLTPVDAAALPRLFGRERDLARLADALGRRLGRAPVLVGAPGSGRTALALQLARVAPEPVFRLDATAYEDEDALARDLRSVAEAGGIAVLDDLDRVPSEAAPAFLPALGHAWSTGVPRVLVLVSPEGHARMAQWLPGAMASIDAIAIAPLVGPALADAIAAAAPAIAAAHGLTLGSDVDAAELGHIAEHYLTGLAMPKRALDLLDLACARTRREGGRVLVRATWRAIVSERAGVPEARIAPRGDEDALAFEQRLGERVVGHERIVATLARLVRRNRAGFGGQRPILSALLLGPSGVGKTELAKALARALTGQDDALVRLDMSEYAEPHAVARIVGAPPGYVGHEHGGALSEPLLARPRCVVLLDEIEKAHRDVHRLLLQVFDEGHVTDGRGRRIDFRRAALVMTSNLGADRVRRSRDGLHMNEDEVLAVARRAFPIELWNRIEAPLVLHPLSSSALAEICRRLAANGSDRLFEQRGIRYHLSDDACLHLVGLAGEDPSLGARPLRHLLVREVESTIADAILRGEVEAGRELEVHVHDGRITLR